MPSKNHNPQSDVLIVGAGPVGMSLALALQQLSVGVRVIDKAPETKRQPRAAVIWPRAEEVLDDLKLIQPFEEAANPLHAATVYANGHRLGMLEVGHVQSASPHPLIIEQHTTEKLLAQSLAQFNVNIEWSTEATDVQLYDDRAEVKLRHADGSEEQVICSWVIGCEGTSSMIRQRLGIPFEGHKRTNLQVLQANARPTWHYPDHLSQGYFFLAPQVSLGCFPLLEGGYRFFAFTDDPDPSRHDAPTVEEMRDLIAATAHAPELKLELTEPRWITRARFQDRIASTLRQGRGLLVGDAAHAWAPVGGHGMNAGIRGAHNLAWKLAAVYHGFAKEQLLDTYTVEQQATARAVMSEMRFNLLELPLPSYGVQALRMLMPVALSLQPVRRKIESTLSDLEMHYRHSDLAWQRLASRHLRAGDRLPDVEVKSEQGVVSLHKLLSMQHWTLLLYNADSEGGAVDRAREIAAAYRTSIKVLPIKAAGAKAAHRLGNKSLMVLVRPDRHIGLVAEANDGEALQAYLDRFLLRREAEVNRVGSQQLANSF